MKYKSIPRPKKYNEFNVLFGYIDINSVHTAAMIIGNPKNRSSYYIPIDNAYQYADSISGEPTDSLIKLTMTIINALNLSCSGYKLASAIVDHLPELVEMPPSDNDDAIKQAKNYDITITADEKTVFNS